MQTAEVVIVGGGIVGASIAWHLTEAGCRNVSSWSANRTRARVRPARAWAACARSSPPSPISRCRCTQFRSTPAFDERLGHPAGYRAQGYLFVATEPAHLEYLQTNQALQKSLGLKQARMLTRDEIVAMVPQLRSDDILGGSFCPTDGFVDPYSVMVGFTTLHAKRARPLWRSTEVTAIHHDGSGVTGVETTRGAVSTPVVVNARGRGLRRLPRWPESSCRSSRMRRMLIPTEPFDGVSHEIPMVIDMTQRLPLPSREPGFLLAWNDPEETAGLQDQLRTIVHREGADSRRRSRALLRKSGRQSQARLGRTVRDVARSSRIIGPVAGSARLLLRQRIQRARRDALSCDRQDGRRPDP